MIRELGFNQLSNKEQQNYIKCYIRKHKDVLSKHLGNLKIFMNTYFGSDLIKTSEIIYSERQLSNSNLCFFDGSIKIPNNLELISNIILNKTFNQVGLFRVNSTPAKIQTAKSLLYDILENRVDIKRGKLLFDTNFDLIDCCELYKDILRSYNSTIIPSEIMNDIKKITKIKSEEEKIICIKTLYHAFPKINRCILESNVKLCYEIVKRTSKMNKGKQQLDINGLSIVMTPNLLLKQDQDIAIENVLELVAFCGFLYKEFPEIQGIDLDIYDECKSDE